MKISSRQLGTVICFRVTAKSILSKFGFGKNPRFSLIFFCFPVIKFTFDP